jgi:hypothetical protein
MKLNRLIAGVTIALQFHISRGAGMQLQQELPEDMS